MRYGYLVVEGPHDVEVVGRLLKPLGLSLLRHLDQLDGYLLPLVPRSFPAADKDLLKRVEVPSFFGNAQQVIAVRSAGGDGVSKLATALKAPLTLDRWAQSFAAIGLLLDADAQPAEQRLRQLLAALVHELSPLWEPSAFGAAVARSTPRWGTYVLPNNRDPGTMEDLILEAAQVHYSTLQGVAAGYVRAVCEPEVMTSLKASETKELRAPAGVKKATLSTMASALKPGKAIQMALQDHRFLEAEALQQPQAAALQRFLIDLFELT